MKLTQKDNRFKVINYDAFSDDNQHSRQGPNLPSDIRAIFAGSSNSGKTNLILSLLLSPHGISFKNIYLFSKTLEQPKYKFLKRVMDGEAINFKQFSDGSEVKEVPNHTVVIHDDVTFDPHFDGLAKVMFSRGRHFGLCVFLLAQSYAKISKGFVRDNSNVIVLFEQDGQNMKLVHRDHASDVSYDNLMEMATTAWKEPYSFLCIDKTLPLHSGRYRVGFTSYFTDI